MKLFIDQLIEKIEAKNSHICVGLDPHPDMLPDFLLEKYCNIEGVSAEIGFQTEGKSSLSEKSVSENQQISREGIARAVLEFNQNIVDAVAEFTAVVKPQAAFYELLGLPGIKTLKQTIEYAKDNDLLVILDGKRNDIGSTAFAYARAYLGEENSRGIKAGEEGKDYYFQNEIEADCITINPYLGRDGVEPFLRREDRGAIVLLKTSNQSGSDIQDLDLQSGDKVYHKVAELISDWGKEVIGENGYSNLAAVVGATYPGELKELRQKMTDTFFLIPGFGFQGGEAKDIVHGFDEQNQGAVVNSSRGINFAYQREPWNSKFEAKEYAEAAREAARKMKEEINELLTGGGK